MRIRNEYLEKGKSVSDSETLTVDVDILDAISAITIVYEAENGATSNQGVYLHDDIDSIDLVDGSEEIFSLNGLETVLLNCFELGHYPYAVFTEAGGAKQYEAFRIHFGRYVGDPEYWLDPTEFRNLQLRLAHSLTISATAGFATGTGKVDVIAHIFDSKPSGRRGYFVTKEQYSFTSASSGIEKVDLPTDYPWRMLIQRAAENAVGIDTDITNIKVNAGGGKYVPVDMNMLDIVQLNAERFGAFTVGYELKRTDGDTIDTCLHVITGAHLNSKTDMDLASVDGITANRVTAQVIKLTTTPEISKETSDVALNLLVSGYAPYGAVVVPLGDPADPETWFDAPSFDKVKLELTQGADGATCQTILQQVRS